MSKTAWRRTFRIVVAAAVAAVLLGSAVPAWGTGAPIGPPPLPGGPSTPPNVAPLPGVRGPVPGNVFANGRDLSGLTQAEALTIIYWQFNPSHLPSITAKAGAKTYTLSSAAIFDLDTQAMLDQAYAANGVDVVNLSPIYLCDHHAVYSFVAQVAASDRPATNARWYVSNKRLKLAPEVAGKKTDLQAARTAVLAAMQKEAVRGAAQPAVVLPVAAVSAKVTTKNIGRAILVVLSERRLRLYDPANGGGIMKEYRCAVGQPDWPTPTGTFKIVEKRYMPTWVNPGSSWGTGMPPSIGPGPNNPLGTRALNLNADGIRIHGTNNVDSIGTAASHGCMRLVRHDIEELYDLVVVGTPVFIIK